MPTIGDCYIKGNAVVEITSVTDKHVKYKIHSSGDTVTVGHKEFDELSRKTLENGGRFSAAVMNDEEFN